MKVEVQKNSKGQWDGPLLIYFKQADLSADSRKLKWESCLKEGKLDGKSSFYKQNKIRAEQFFEEGKPSGDWTYFDHNGNPLLENFYENHDLVKSHHYFNEKVRFTAYWQKGGGIKYECQDISSLNKVKVDRECEINHYPQKKSLYIKYWPSTHFSLKKRKYSKVESLHIDHSPALIDISTLFSDFPHLMSLVIMNTSIPFIPKEIEVCKDLEELKVWGINLLAVPEEIGNLDRLKTLDLSHNRMISLPESIGRLTQLESLILADTRLEELPQSIGRLKNLSCLDLQNDAFAPNLIQGLRELPAEISQCRSLAILKLDGNQLFQLPQGLSTLALTHLSMGSNNLLEFLADLHSFSALIQLNLSNNYLTDLPDMRELKALQTLHLEQNYLSEVPDLSSQEGLLDLFLNENTISCVPEHVLKLKKLRSFNMDKNPVISVAEKILKRKSGLVVRQLKEILKHIKDIQTPRITDTVFCKSLEEVEARVLKSDPRYELILSMGGELFP
ncbi:MAG: hypothetical protein PF447_07550 [Spirochaetaceae bacterium]|jgi:Leucine-rich repeat (LRR) protein|nr:hypothetical protein [Spirochaetaceae bacterium]